MSFTRSRRKFTRCAVMFFALMTILPAETRQVAAQAKATPKTSGPLNSIHQTPQSKSQLIAELRSQIDADLAQVDLLKKELGASSGSDSSFAKAETHFKKLDASLKEVRKKIEEIEAQDPVDVDDLSAAQKDAKELERQRSEALSAFELEIDQTKVLQEKIVTIEMKIEAGRAALERLMSPGISDKNASTKIVQNTGNTDRSADRPAVTPVSNDAQSTKKPETNSTAELAKSIAMGSPAGLVGASTTKTATPVEESNSNQISGSLISRRIRDQVRELRDIIEDSRAKLEEDRKDEEIVAAMVANLERQVQLETKLLENARKKADLANGKLSKAQEEFRIKSIADAPQDLLQDLADKLLELDKEFQSARDESRGHSNKVGDIQNERAAKQELLRLAHEKRAELQKRIDEAEKKISELKDPTSLLNLVDWLTTRGVRIFLILITMLGSRSALRSLGSRAIRMMVHSQEKVDREDRNDRAETLVSVYSNAVSVSVIGGGLVLMAQEAGIPIGPLLGGVAIFGLAVAFGAQNLIKDYFYGFVVLLENQFSVNDVIQVGTVTGLVERITLRMTVIRDAAGTVHFVPNGSMTTVSNFSYDWSRAVFEIPVSYNVPVDSIIQQILLEGKALRLDKEFGPLCLDDLTMLGVDNMSENAVMIKFFIKTKPLKQWPVKREMLRRLINRFDELGIDLQATRRVTTTTIRSDEAHEKIMAGPNVNSLERLSHARES